MRRVGQGLSERGISVVTFNFPYMETGRRVPDRGPSLEAAYAAVWAEVFHTSGREAVAMLAGGKSMGGRIGTQVAAQSGFDPPPAGIVCFGFPLHPPGKPNVRRDAHLPAIGCPLLFLHGTRDPFGSPTEMRAVAETLPEATLAFVEDGDHSLEAPVSRDPARRSLDGALDLAAAWMRARAGLS
jgi:predicted alpha/beta-hydrolase family hydrolase